MLVARYRKTRVIFCALLGALLAPMGVVLLVMGATILAVMLGVALTLVAGLVCASCLARLGQNRDILVITAEGVLDRRCLDRMIPWDDIVALTEVEGMGRPLFRLRLRGSAAPYVLPWARREDLVEEQDGDEVVISAQGLTLSDDDLRATLRARLGTPSWTASQASFALGCLGASA